MPTKKPLVWSAHTAATKTPDAYAELVVQLPRTPAVVFFFHSPNHDGSWLAKKLRARFPRAEVLGCSTCGEFTDRGHSKGGVAALALDKSAVKKAAGALAKFDKSVDSGIKTAAAAMSRKLRKKLRDLDPAKHVGVVLLDGSNMKEEVANEALGNLAPLLSFVGGSAGDNIAFKKTWVHCDGQSTTHGAALLTLELKVPFRVLKTCNFTEGTREFTITKVDTKSRTVLELDGRPAAQVYAEAVGLTADKLDFSVFLHHPLGVMIDGQPWLRSIIAAKPDGGLFFACALLKGMRITLMKRGDLVKDTKKAFDQVGRQLGRKPRGGLMFNCAYRLLEMEAHQFEKPYFKVLSSFPLAGFHTHGESWLGHINQTLTGLVLG